MMAPLTFRRLDVRNMCRQFAFLHVEKIIRFNCFCRISNMFLTRLTTIHLKTGGICQLFSSSTSVSVTSKRLVGGDQYIPSEQESLGKGDYDDSRTLMADVNEKQITRLNINPNAEQAIAILSWMNCASENDFHKLKNVSRKLAENIIELRTSLKSFSSLDDLLKIPGIGQKTLNRICDNISNPTKLSESNQKISKLSGLSSESLQNIKTIVSISIGLKQIGWVHLDKSLQLDDWKVHDLPEDVSPSKWDPFTYFNLVDDIINQLPSCDLFLLEHKRYVQLNNNKSVAQVYIFLRAIESLFYGILNTRYKRLDNFKAVSMSESITCRHFDLIVGNRRKSGQKIVDGFLKKSLDFGNEDTRAVLISRSLAEVYQEANKYQREVLANALLQCLKLYNMQERFPPDIIH